MTSFGEQVRKIREKMKLSQIDLALMLDTDQKQISRIEQDKSNPTLKTMVRISEALGKKLIIQIK